MSAHDEHPSTDDLMRRTLEERQDFDLVFIDGERWGCRLVEYGREALVVLSAGVRYLVPIHAIKYIVLDEDTAQHVIALAVNEVLSLQEFLANREERAPRGPVARLQNS